MWQRDEDFDTSYESLLSLAATLGEVKPRSVPEKVLKALPTAQYRDWMSVDSDERCSICLDDVRVSEGSEWVGTLIVLFLFGQYMLNDPVMKLPDCTHWLHRDCLKVLFDSFFGVCFD